EVTNEDALRALMEEEVPGETRAALSTTSLNERGEHRKPLPPFERLRQQAEFDPARLAENALEVLSLAHTLLEDTLGSAAPLAHEIAVVEQLQNVVDKYRSARLELKKKAFRATVVTGLASIYEQVERSWAHNASGTGIKKVDVLRTADQKAAIES